MEKIMMSVVAGIVVVTLAFTISMYNKLVMRRNQVSSVEASVDVQLKRRYDLLPNLVATAKEYMSHERSLLERIVTLRESAKLAHTTSEKFQLNNEISGVLRLIANLFNFQKGTFFDIPQNEAEVPNVGNLFKQ